MIPTCSVCNAKLPIDPVTRIVGRCPLHPVGVEPSANPGEDKGIEREARVQPCTLSTWCVLETHKPEIPCLEIERTPIPPSDFGPKAATRRRS